MIKSSKTIRKMLTSFLGNRVSLKRYKSTNLHLAYKASQHLNFLLKKEISYENVIQNHIKHYITKGDTIFDIGANIGQYMLYFAHLVGKEGKVVSYEPDHFNFAFLNFNTLYNALDNVYLEKLGLASKEGELEFFIDTQTSRTSSFKQQYISPYNYKGLKEVVKVSTIDKEIEKHGIPQLIKIDTEGFEEEIILGFTKFNLNTKFLVEVREDSKGTVYNYFTNFGFSCKCLDFKQEVPIHNEQDIPSFANLLFYKD